MKIAILGLCSAIQAHRLTHKNTCNIHHACDFVNDDGTDVNMDLNPEYLQTGATIRIRTKDDDDTVAGAREKFALMQA